MSGAAEYPIHGIITESTDERLRRVSSQSGFDLDQLRLNFSLWAKRLGEYEARLLLHKKEEELGLDCVHDWRDDKAGSVAQRLFRCARCGLEEERDVS
jgi:hypothetical protein